METTDELEGRAPYVVVVSFIFLFLFSSLLLHYLLRTFADGSIDGERQGSMCAEGLGGVSWW